ncbi:MAG TPA: hypothetical protein VFW23_02170 [Tepidisphaeraceae bacterium]|nr:hypothetical protein [Tepidisphaeraceae bacterium]
MPDYSTGLCLFAAEPLKWRKIAILAACDAQHFGCEINGRKLDHLQALQHPFKVFYV